MDRKSKQQLMDYLFDEMNSDEREAFESKLRSNRELRERLEELKATHSVLSAYGKDLEVNMPAADLAKPFAGYNSEEKVHKLKYVWMAAAAVLIITIFTGLFHSVQFGKTEQGYYLAFGQPPVTKGIAEEEVNEMLTQIQAENALMLNSMMEQIRQEQTTQFNESLTALADYYEERRNRDLMLFTEGLLQLEENTANQIDQTNRALNGIIYALSNE
ncbi:hypothetical protein [Rhodohalobacter halophilus]|uniref:hypothetical protein n=1 Tax=Rhodohalobacter halophilus TaxID=1812810 RepID=UPI00083FA021|nr:hypothetical protein [Rhodohalobacter halophilus]